MTRQSNSDSILTGNFGNIIDFMVFSGTDEADQLARRAVSIILATDNMPQTGEEANTDPFVANMLASDALASISENITHYPFVRDTRVPLGFDQCGSTSSAHSDVLGSARDLIDRAAALVPSLPNPFEEVFWPVEGTLEADLDALILHIFEETGHLPAGVLVLVIDDEAEEPLQ